MEHIEKYLTHQEEYSQAENFIVLELKMQNKSDTAIRQYKIGPYFADFFFPEWNLVLEIDGKQWHKQKNDWDRDRRRDSYMNKRNYCVVRVSGKMAMSNPYGILNVIKYLTKPVTYAIEDYEALKTIYQLKMLEIDL